jgi:hypothetical protein
MNNENMIQELLCIIQRNPEPEYLHSVLTYACSLDRSSHPQRLQGSISAFMTGFESNSLAGCRL